MGRLLEDISTKMQKKVTEGPGDQMRLLVHSTHDTTLAGICASLDVFDEKSVIVCLRSCTIAVADGCGQMARLYLLHLV